MSFCAVMEHRATMGATFTAGRLHRPLPTRRLAERRIVPAQAWKAGVVGVLAALALALLIRELALAVSALPPAFAPLTLASVMMVTLALGITTVVVFWMAGHAGWNARDFVLLSLAALGLSFAPVLALLQGRPGDLGDPATLAGVAWLLLLNLAAFGVLVGSLVGWATEGQPWEAEPTSTRRPGSAPRA